MNEQITSRVADQAQQVAQGDVFATPSKSGVKAKPDGENLTSLNGSGMTTEEKTRQKKQQAPGQQQEEGQIPHPIAEDVVVEVQQQRELVSQVSKPSKNSKQSLKLQKSKRGSKQDGPRIGVKRALTYENSESDGPQLGSINGDGSVLQEESKDDQLITFAQEHPLTPIPMVVKKQKLSEESEHIMNADGSNSEKGFNNHSVKIHVTKAAKRPENAAMDNE